MQEVEMPSGPNFVMPNTGGTLTQQIRALLERRASTAMRDKKTFLMGCIAPVPWIICAELIAVELNHVFGYVLWIDIWKHDETWAVSALWKQPSSTSN